MKHCIVYVVVVDDLVVAHIQEIRRGSVVVASLLALEEPGYGYGLLRTLADSGIDVDGNTLYPLLRRLEDQGLLTSEWNTSGTKPRKYYTTSKAGMSLCRTLLQEHSAISRSFAALQRGPTS